jgi:nucleoside-diphosphate-sugar epimerase
MPSQRFIVTGARGFVGSALVARMPGEAQALRFGEDRWERDLADARFDGAIVFHLAARVHGRSGDEAAYLHDNRDKTLALARAAAAGGARRLVFASSVKAMGEQTGRAPFRIEDEPHPRDAYGRSKLAAERAIAEAARGTALEWSVVRAPLVLGPGAKGNLRALLRLCDSPWPLPFGALRNRRSFVHVDDLARLLLACAEAPQAAGRTYLAAHREPFSTAALVGAMRAALGRPRRLFAVPPAALETLAAPAGRRASLRPLTRSLEVDPSAAERELDWRAEIALAAAVEDMVAAYRSERRA